jgi:hypothetical protein
MSVITDFSGKGSKVNTMIVCFETTRDGIRIAFIYMQQ